MLVDTVCGEKNSHTQYRIEHNVHVHGMALPAFV